MNLTEGGWYRLLFAPGSGPGPGLGSGPGHGPIIWSILLSPGLLSAPKRLLQTKSERGREILRERETDRARERDRDRDSEIMRESDRARERGEQ